MSSLECFAAGWACFGVAFGFGLYAWLTRHEETDTDRFCSLVDQDIDRRCQHPGPRLHRTVDKFAETDRAWCEINGISL